MNKHDENIIRKTATILIAAGLIISWIGIGLYYSDKAVTPLSFGIFTTFMSILVLVMVNLLLDREEPKG